YDSDEEWFTQPADCDFRMVCSETGLLPTDHCVNLVTDYFIPLVSSAKICDNMREIFLSPDEKISYCRVCMPVTGYKKKWFKIINPEMQRYFDERRIAYEKIPPHNPNCERVIREGAPIITSPKNGAEYYISRKDKEPLQLSCNVGNDVNKVYWYINDQFYKSAEVKSKQFFIPDDGPIKISCTDDKGRNKNIWIKVKYLN
ncbi:MAG TPA: penicillin-binding protein 1C, partial [Puia sp.]|nr:penicillin-binding protein 1C [Puia sp.]